MVNSLKKNDNTANKQSSGYKPDRFALIIGAMKSGTTSLYEILSQHPEICPSKLKEPDFFIEDRNASSCDDYLNLWDWKLGKHSVALESSVAYTKAPLIKGVPERIAKLNLGKYRFIYMLRDPFARIESQVRHGLFAGWGKPLDAGVPEDVISFSRYAMQLDCYLEYFSKNDIMLVTLEEFKNNPHGVLKRICEFLQIDSEFQFSEVEKPRNSGEFFNAPASVAKVTQGVFGQFLVRRVLPQNIKNWLRSIITRLSKKQQKDPNLGRWKLRPDERSLIMKKISEDLRRLETDFGIDTQKYWHIPSQILNKN